MPAEDRAERLRRELFFRVLTVTRPPPAVARALAESITGAYFSAGSTLFKRGEDADDIFFIASGEVALEAPGEDPWLFEEGAVVGILDVNVGRPRSRTATAVTDVEAMVLKGEDWVEIIEDNFEYGLATRRFIATDLYRLIRELAPTGGFERAPEHDENMRPPELSPVASLVVFINMKLFTTASVQSLAELAAAAKVIEVEAGDQIFGLGEAGDALYCVAWGIVELDHPGPPHLHAAFGAGSLVGGAMAFCGALGSCVARARTAAVLLKLELPEVDDVAEDHFDLAHAMMRSLALERERIMRLTALAVRDRASAVPPPDEVPSDLPAISP